MIKRFICSVLIVILCVPLSGCWDYRGLNKLSIVSGVAIDRNVDNNNYQLTIETLDLSGDGKESSAKAQIIEAEGKTIFDAVRNAKKRLSKKLYFGNMQMIVISNQIAKEEGIKAVLDWFMRDAEPRGETVGTLISQEKTAKDILLVSGIDDKILSKEIAKIIETDNKVTASTKNIKNYQVFDILKGDQGSALVLPVVHCIDNKGKKVVEVNGIAIFKEDKLQGYLSPEKTHYYLFTVDDVNGGILPFTFIEENQNKQVDIAFEIMQNKTKKSYSYDGNRLKVLFDINTKVYLAEVGDDINVLKKENIEKIKTATTLMFAQQLEAVIKKVQTEFGLDIFGVGMMIQQKNPALWAELKENWDYYIRTMEVEVTPEFVIVNTGLTK